MWRLGLIGHPVAHSLSPRIHAAALSACGLDGQYSLFDAPDIMSLEVYLAALRAGALDGVNVTLPHKQDAAGRCDVLVGDASVLGVANTLVVRDGHLEGHNTDVAGLVLAVQARWPDLVVREAAVLGAGGAARAAVLAARRLGAQRVRLWNRTRERADALAAALGDGVVVSDSAIEACANVELVLQAGSGEMGLVPGSDAWSEALVRAQAVVAASAPEAVVVDLVYKPRPTVWVEAATRAGRAADDGLAMLVHQAALAFALWTGQAPPIAALVQAVV